MKYRRWLGLDKLEVMLHFYERENNNNGFNSPQSADFNAFK